MPLNGLTQYSPRTNLSLEGCAFRKDSYASISSVGHVHFKIKVQGIYSSKAQEYKGDDVTGARELVVFIYVHACVCTCIQYF